MLLYLISVLGFTWEFPLTVYFFLVHFLCEKSRYNCNIYSFFSCKPEESYKKKKWRKDTYTCRLGAFPVQPWNYTRKWLSSLAPSVCVGSSGEPGTVTAFRKALGVFIWGFSSHRWRPEGEFGDFSQLVNPNVLFLVSSSMWTLSDALRRHSTTITIRSLKLLQRRAFFWRVW